MADGCRDAAKLIDDNVNCGLALEMTRWMQGGHEERSFSRPIDIKTRSFFFKPGLLYGMIVCLCAC